MRHIYAYRVTYIIALLIVLVAMLFAWLRSLDVPPLEQTGVGHHPPDVVWVAAYQPAQADSSGGHADGPHDRDGEPLSTKGMPGSSGTPGQAAITGSLVEGGGGHP